MTSSRGDDVSYRHCHSSAVRKIRQGHGAIRNTRQPTDNRKRECILADQSETAVDPVFYVQPANFCVPDKISVVLDSNPGRRPRHDLARKVHTYLRYLTNLLISKPYDVL